MRQAGERATHQHEQLSPPTTPTATPLNSNSDSGRQAGQAQHESIHPLSSQLATSSFSSARVSSTERHFTQPHSLAPSPNSRECNQELRSLPLSSQAKSTALSLLFLCQLVSFSPVRQAYNKRAVARTSQPAPVTILNKDQPTVRLNEKMQKYNRDRIL